MIDTEVSNDAFSADAQPAGGATPATADPEAAEKAKAEALKQERLKQIKATTFDRRPSKILELWSRKDQPEEPVAEAPVTDEQPVAETQAEPAKPEPTEEELAKAAFTKSLDEASIAVTLGQWDQFAEMLKDEALFSKEEAIALYRQMLTQLTAGMGLDFSQVVGLSDEMQKFMQTMMSNRRNNPAVAYAEKHAISFADIIAIIQASPQTIEDNDVQTIAGMLRETLGSGSQSDDFVAALEQADESTLTKDQAALLLSIGSLDKYTPRFLISIEQAKTDGNIKVLNLWARHFMSLYSSDGKESEREQAWQVTLAALEVKNAEKDQRSQALTRAVSLAPAIRRELGQAWLQESFTKYPERGQEILAAIGTATSQRLAQTPQDNTERQHNLELQHEAVTALLATNPEIDSQWTAILGLLASNWLQEANVSYSYSQKNSYGRSIRRDPFGNIYYMNSGGMDDGMEQQPMRMGQIRPVEPDEILKTAPEGIWFDTISDSIRPQYTMMLGRLWLKVNEDAKAFPYIESLSETHPEIARELAEEFLRIWTKNHNPNEASEQTNSYMFMYGYETKADKIPLTRSKQERNLEELSGWVARLRELPIADDVDEKLLVRAFMTCHSVAEVYDVGDIERIFGQWDAIEPATMASLIQAMRANLAGVWRDPNVQRDSKTNRKKADIQAEVKRGFEIARNVLDKALETYPADWQLLLAKASVMHDENDYLQEVSPSTEFSERRSAAFAVFAKAAEEYVKIAPELADREQVTDVFDNWFYAALGATDLQGISEKNQLAPSEIERINASMDQLDGEVGKKHRDRFANSLFNRMSAVSPSCKVRYLDAGFKIVGENPLAEEAKKVHDYYQDLVTELELVTRIDGNATIGHEEPFGVYVDLRHTKELEREAGGFAKYLQNQNNGYYAYNYGRPTENYRDKFQDATMASLQEQFEVLSVTFNHDDVKSRPDREAGWRFTPYAYLLLQARGPEVDKLPALRIDLDFLDTSGYVVLPIASAPLPIDASEARAETTQMENLSIVQVLDERQSQNGKLIVEAKATARGLVPNLENLLDTDQDDFQLASVEDSGVSVIEFDKESILPVVLSERTYTLNYSPKNKGDVVPNRFGFASPLLETSKVSYQRYVDADLEEVESTVALVEEYGSPLRKWLIAGLCALAGLIFVTGLLVAVSRRGKKGGVANAEQETEITPFSLLVRLKEAYGDETVPEDKRNRLREDISIVEGHYFAEASSHERPDLQAIANRWH